MNNLYILTKQEFNSLYRFGKIPLILNKVVKILDKSSREIDDLIFKEFQSLPYFTGDEEYLIITFEIELNDNIWLEIENITEVIPLTRAAKNSIQMKFDTRLKFEDARFENVILKVEEYIDLQERKSGAKAFWKLCQVKNTFTTLVQDETIAEAYYNKIEGRKSNDFKRDFLVHLISYDRYEFFPNSDLGYFYDVGEIFAHSKGKRSFFGSGFHAFLEKNNQHFSELDLLQIAQIISDSDEITNFTNLLTVNNLKLYISSVLYLKFKNDLADRETIKRSETGKLIVDVKKENLHINELNLAIYLTGSFFGYQKFYDDLYDIVDLNIFKEKAEPVINALKITTAPILDIANLESSPAPIHAILTTEPFEPEAVFIENVIIEENVDVQSTETPTENTIVESDLINQVPAINEYYSPSNLVNSSKQYNDFEKLVLDLIITILDEENGIFELKTERLTQIKKAIATSIPVKSNLDKKDIIRFLQQTFEMFFKLEKKGDKCFISKIDGGSLFNNS